MYNLFSETVFFRYNQYIYQCKVHVDTRYSKTFVYNIKKKIYIKIVDEGKRQDKFDLIL